MSSVPIVAQKVGINLGHTLRNTYGIHPDEANNSVSRYAHREINMFLRAEKLPDLILAIGTDGRHGDIGDLTSHGVAISGGNLHIRRIANTGKTETQRGMIHVHLSLRLTSWWRINLVAPAVVSVRKHRSKLVQASTADNSTNTMGYDLLIIVSCTDVDIERFCLYNSTYAQAPSTSGDIVVHEDANATETAVNISDDEKVRQCYRS